MPNYWHAAAAAATLIPVLRAAAEFFSHILQQISRVQQNTKLALRIAIRCARALATISKHLETLAVTSEISDNMKSFEANLYEVQDFVENETDNKYVEGRAILCATVGPRHSPASLGASVSAHPECQGGFRGPQQGT
ncbi:hypothetical protein DFS33DRAFT_665562 [Desarmillaria ectypa]|nr:hypothetical protein DFS33DRAFT_665562 [Desarmillaria ectypa]